VVEAKHKICLGAISGAHGVRGEVRVESFTARPKDVAAYGPLTDETGRRTFVLTIIGERRGQLIARIGGIDDRGAAEALGGLRLYITRSALPDTAEDEYYHEDLIGLRCTSMDGRDYRIVRAIYDFGAGDLIEVERPGGERAILPFTRAVVPHVDLATGHLAVDPPVEVEAPSEVADVEAPVEIRP